MSFLRFLATLALLVATVGCSAEQYAEDADRQVEDILREKQWQAFGAIRPFTIEEDPDRLREVLLRELHEARERAREELRSTFEQQSEARTGTPPVGGPRLTSVGQRRQDSESAEVAVTPQDDESDVGQAVEGDDPASQEAQIGNDLEETLRDIETRYADLLVLPTPTESAQLAERVVTLVDCLEIAAANSRDYQRQEETVYLSALNLTLQRFQFELQYGVRSGYDWSSAPGAGPRQRDGTLRTTLSLSRLLASGGLLVFDFTNSVLKNFTGIEFGSGSRDVSSSIGASFTQPLLQGFGRRIAQEPLIQSEREVVYSLRSFERFRREFALDIASSYYGLVQQRDAIRNAYRNYLQVINSREQVEALADMGRRTQVDTDRARQSELNARDSWIRTSLNYDDALDRFKITLGLPIEANLAIDPSELERLKEKGLNELALGERDGIEIALSHRLDFLNQQDFLVDAERQIRITSDQLRTRLDVSGGYNVSTDRDTVFDFRGGDATWRAGVELDLPVNQLRERNSYRRALITVEQVKRNTTLAEDRIKLDVRASLRRLAQLEQSYTIQVASVQLAERRVEATAIELLIGRAQVLDALDASDDLVNSRNQLTSSVVDYELEVLNFYLSLGLLRVADNGIEFAYPDAIEGTP